MATEDEHRLYALLNLIHFDSESTRAQLDELPPDRQLELEQARADYRGDGGKPIQYRWFRLAEYVTESFAGVSPSVDATLGKLASPSPGTGEAAAEDIGRRWRSDALDTAWRIIVSTRMADVKLPQQH